MKKLFVSKVGYLGADIYQLHFSDGVVLQIDIYNKADQHSAGHDADIPGTLLHWIDNIPSENNVAEVKPTFKVSDERNF